jgi:cytochrome c5
MFILFLVLLSATFAFSSMGEGKTLFEAKCSKCHALSRALNKNKDLAGWQKTTKKMIKYAKGAISDADAEKISEYLAGRNAK